MSKRLSNLKTVLWALVGVLVSVSVVRFVHGLGSAARRLIRTGGEHGQAPVLVAQLPGHLTPDHFGARVVADEVRLGFGRVHGFIGVGCRHRDHDHDAVAPLPPARYPVGHVPDALGTADRGAAVFLDN